MKTLSARETTVGVLCRRSPSRARALSVFTCLHPEGADPTRAARGGGALSCRQRTQEWLDCCGEALDVTTTYVSNAAHREAVEQGREIIATGKRSGWIVETRPRGRGHLWQCRLLSPAGKRAADIETRELGPMPAPAGRLRWRLGVGWHRDVHAPWAIT